MSTHIVQIGKHKFVCGLFWQSLSRPRDLHSEAAELAKRIDADLMVIRKDNAIAQAGFTSARDGVRRGMYSLAAIVSKTIAIEGATCDGQQQQVHNWLSAFKLPDGMWIYLAVRDANFLPNGDFAGSKEEVLERLHGDYGLGGWNVVIGNKELEEHGFHNFCAKQIEDLIPHRKDGRIKVHKWWELHAVRPVLRWKLGLLIASLIAVPAATGLYFWQQHQAELAAQARAEAEAAEIARKKMQGQAVPAVASHPWSQMPLPEAFVEACVDKLAPITPGGWLLDDYVCSPAKLSHTWSRGDSNLAYLLEQVPGAQAEMSGDKASHSEPLSLSAGQDEDLLDLKTLLPLLQSEFQLLGVPLTLSLMPRVLVATTNAANGAPNAAQAVDWQTVAFVANGAALPPADIAALLNRPGIRINKLTYRGGAWSIEGVIHAK